MLTLDPSVDPSPISLNIFKNIYDQLTDIAADGSVKPQLATSWEVSADAKVWTFTIRPNVKFHDGSLLTVDDVVELVPEDHEGREIPDARVSRQGRLGREGRRRQGTLHSDGSLCAIRPAGFADLDPAAQGLCGARRELCDQSGRVRPVPPCALDQGRPDRARGQSGLLRRRAEGRHGDLPPCAVGNPRAPPR